MRIAFLIIASVLATATAQGSAPLPGRPDAGLCVVIGAKSAAELGSLTNGGRMLVECLVGDRAAADALRNDLAKAGMLGLTSVKHQPAGQSLPYVANTVNLLIADQIEAGEAARVMAPFGAMIIAGKTTTIPMPKAMDEWPQANHDPAQRAWSSDRLAGPPTGLRWFSPIPSLSSLGANKVPVRIAGGRMVTYISDGKRSSLLEARDAFSGVRLWAIPATISMRSTHCQFLSMNDRRIYAFLSPTSPISVLDAATGAVVRTLDNGPSPKSLTPATGPSSKIKIGQDAPTRSAAFSQVILDGTKLIVTYGPTIWVYDEPSGALRWTKTRSAERIWASTLGDALVLAEQSRPFEQGKGPDESLYCDRLVSLDPATGAERWTQDQVTEGGLGMIYQPPLLFEDLVVLPVKYMSHTVPVPVSRNGPGAGWCYTGYSLATGKQVWRSLTKDAGGKLPTAFFICGAWISEAGRMWTGYVGDNFSIDVRTGQLADTGHAGGDNCFWTRGVGDWFTVGPFWMDTKTKQIYRGCGMRMGCNDGAYPAYGSNYTSWHFVCPCNNFLTGAGCQTSGPLPTPVPDAQRLETFAAVVPVAATSRGWPGFLADGTRMSLASEPLPTQPKEAWRTKIARPLPAGPLATDWANDPTLWSISPPVRVGDVLVVARCQSHELVALDPATGAERWSRALGGRIDSAPTIANGYIYVGCRDGWLYVLRASDGAICWRYLLAENRSQIVSASQLESLWPALGVTLVHDGAVYACAGRNSQLDGGLWVAKLDAVSGKQLWRQRIASAGNWENSVLLDPPYVLGGRVWMGKISLDPATGEVLDEMQKIYGLGKNPGYLPGKAPRWDDPRAAVSNTGNNSFWRGNGGRGEGYPAFPGIGASSLSMMWPAVKVNHRASACGSWATDATLHIRSGGGSLGRKGNKGSIGGLTAWPADDALAGSSKKEPMWSAPVSQVAALAMDAKHIVVIEGGSGKTGSVFYTDAPVNPAYVVIDRANGKVVGARTPLPATPLYHGLAAADGEVVLSYADGSVGLWR